MQIPLISKRESLYSVLSIATFFIYLGVILTVLPAFTAWPHRLIFLGYALFVFVVLRTSTSVEEDKIRRSSKHLEYLFWILLGLTVIFFIYSRLFMFLRYHSTPLGYDTGSYLFYHHLTTTLGTSIKTIVSNNLAYTPWLPFHFLGLNGLPTIQGLHLLNQFLTFGAIYFLIRSLPQQLTSRLTISAGLFLFATSITQFMAYWWFFYKESMAIPFALIAVGLFLRKSLWAIPVAVFSAALHLHPAVPFTLAFLLLFVFFIGRWIILKQPIERGWLTLTLSGIGAVLLLILIKGWQDVISHIEYVSQFKGLATSAQEWQVAQTKGLFIPFSTVRLNSLFYLPFALIGILSAQTWRATRQDERVLILPLTFLVALVLSSFPFVYQNRSLIILDLLLIILAARPLTQFVHRIFHEPHGKIMVGLFLTGALLFSGRLVWNHQPQIYKNEIAEIRAISSLRKEGDYAMAISSLYTPWVFMFTDFKDTIVPGWLYWNRWDLTMWKQFWTGRSDERRLELLRIYGDHDIYMFVGSRDLPLHPNLQNFLDKNPQIKKLSPHIWRYSSNAPSSLEL